MGSGASRRLTDSVRETGSKDMVAQPIMEKLIKLGQDLRKASPAKAPDEVQAILTQEVKKANDNGGAINPLLTMDSMYHYGFQKLEGSYGHRC